MAHRAYISLGSNVEPRLERIRRAKDWLAERHSLVKESSVYETEPLGPGKQNWHLNQVLQLETTSSPATLLADCLAAEQVIGRRRREKWGAREIDIDILLFDSLVIDTVDDGIDLHIPHLELPNRKFILIPLAEIAPDAVYSRNGKTIQQLLNECNDALGVKLFTN